MEKEKVIDEITEKEIQQAKEKLEKMQVEINERVAKELKDPTNIDYNVLESDIRALVEETSISVTTIGASELKAYRTAIIENTGKTISESFDFTNDIMIALQNELNLQNDMLVESALTTTQIYEQLYTTEFNQVWNDVVSASKNASISEIESKASTLAKSNMQGKFLVDDDVTYYVRSNGAHERVQYFFDRNVRQSYTEQHLANTSELNSEIGNDLLRVSAHADCSNLCAPYQGEILSQSGQDLRYTSLDEAISGGLFHWNCRHSISPYIEGLSEPDLWNDERLSESERKAQYQARQQAKYYSRQATKYNDRYNRAKAIGDSTSASKYRNLRNYYSSQSKNVS